MGVAILLFAAPTSPTMAHNPIFAPGAHVTYAGGLEMSLGYQRDRASGGGVRETEQEAELEVEYGVTADWTVKMAVPMAHKAENRNASGGLGDVVLGTRYRFLRLDTLGVQRSAAVLLKLKLPTAADDGDPRLGSGSTDVVGGLLYGHESRRWYYNGALRYRLNTDGGGGLNKGDRQFVDLVGGVRPVLGAYRAPDTVLFLELNWENAGADTVAGTTVQNTGGWQLFVSPGVFWTVRNVAVRAGVQIPVLENLEGSAATSDYRFKLQFKYQF